MARLNNKKVIDSFFWRFLERCGAQGIALVVSIVLARILDPSVYGTVSLIVVFTSILEVFVDGGLGNALIQKIDADEIDFSSVFFFNIVLCLVLYLIMYLASPGIARFYSMPEIVPVIRVLCLSIVISGVRNIQQAYVAKNFLFKRFFFATLCGTVVSAIVGIFMAYNGFGVWALVGQSLSNICTGTIVLWLTVRWRPQWVFSPSRLGGLLSYGWKLMASSVIDKLYNDLRVLVIGKVYSAKDLAYYNTGAQVPYAIVNNVNTTIDSVLFPAISTEQKDVNRVLSIARRSIKTGTFIMAPLMLGLAAIAEPLVSLVLTDKWLPSVPFIRIFCVSFMFYPINSANLSAIKALGRSDLVLRLEIIKKVLGITIILITMWISVKAIALGLLVGSLCNLVINSWPNKTLLQYTFFNQLKDISGNLFLAAIMACVVFVLGHLNIPLPILLSIQIISGAIVFFSISWLTKMDSFSYLIGVLKTYVGKK